MVRASNQMNDFLESGRASRGGEGRESPAVQSYEQIAANDRFPPFLLQTPSMLRCAPMS